MSTDYMEGHKVCLNVYDLSQGMTRQLSMTFLGKVIEGICILTILVSRIGAVHSVVFDEFSVESVAQRISDCKPKVLITCNAVMRGSKLIRLKQIVDAALTESSKNGFSLVAQQFEDDKKETQNIVFMSFLKNTNYVEFERAVEAGPCLKEAIGVAAKSFRATSVILDSTHVVDLIVHMAFVQFVIRPYNGQVRPMCALDPVVRAVLCALIGKDKIRGVCGPQTSDPGLEGATKTAAVAAASVAASSASAVA
ncbi:hypothetical protein AgCh_033414 [Apium graveolens]